MIRRYVITLLVFVVLTLVALLGRPISPTEVGYHHPTHEVSK